MPFVSQLLTGLNKIAYPIRKNSTFFLFLYLLGAVCIVFEPWNSLRTYALTELFLDLYLLCLLLCILPQKVERIVKIALSILLYGVALVDNLLFVCTESPLSAAMLRAFIHTNQQEATEALHAFANWNVLSPSILLILLLAVAHLYCTKKATNRVRLLYTNYLSRFSILTAPLLIGSIALNQINKQYLFHRLLLAETDSELPQYLMDASIKTGYYLPIYRLWEALLELQRDDRAIQMLPKSNAQIPIDSCSHLSPKIIWIIGESYNRHHSGLYGYPYATTPYTSRREQVKELIPFTDVITPWNFTTEALEYLFSLHGYGDKGNWYDYPLITSTMLQAGYQVTFLSNQYVVNPAKNLNTLIDTQLLNDTLLSRLQFTHRNQKMHPYDMDLLQDFDSIRPLRATYGLTIFHLHGQHVEFADRVPPHQQYFKSDDYQRPDLTPQQRQILAAYDNATRYVDYVTEQIIRRVEGEEAILIFLSDHGERVFDNHTKEYGRNNALRATDISQQYEIPFWIWASRSYRARHADVWKLIEKAKDKPFMTDNLAQILLYLSGIHTSYYQSQNNPLSPDYQIHRKRLIRGNHEYLR